MSDDVPTSELLQSKPPIRFRRLRIAVSVFFGLLAALLVVLWLQSYRANEIVARTSKSGRMTILGSDRGYVFFATQIHELAKTPQWGPRFIHGWQYEWSAPAQSPLQPRIDFSRVTGRVVLPISLLVLSASVASVMPWIRRFSLRSLLVVTTLVAVVLGFAVWMVR